MAGSVGGTIKLDAEEMLELSRGFRADGKRMVYRGQPHGTSMWPVIRSGDGMVVEQIPEEEIASRDVLVFSTGGEKLVAHRLIRTEEIKGQRRYILRGDFRWAPDPPVGYDSVVGKVVAIERRGKTIATNGSLHRLWVGLWLVLRPLALRARAVWMKIRRVRLP